MATFERDIVALQKERFDVLIIGGGISGAWLAFHAARSGYRTALIEAEDFASQTSASSSKLLHGGIRYLQQFEFGKVRESAMERAHYIYAAPHLSVPVPFLIPTYKDFQRSKFFLNCGMLAYRFLTFGENRLIEATEERMPPISSLTKAQLNAKLDLGDEPHTGAIQFFERHMVNSERMVLAILQSAATHGAVIANHCRAIELKKESDSVIGVRARDALSGKRFDMDARLVVNAAGPWIDELNTNLDGQPPRIRGFAVGSHIVTRQISEHAIALTTKHQSNAKLDRGGRHVFIIPWCGYSLIGTSYDEINQPRRNLLPERRHIEQLLAAINSALPSAKLTKNDLVSGYSGLYPLQTEDIQNTVYQGSGEYVIIDHAEADQTDGLITALGAKYTTGRKLSALTMKRVQRKLGGQLKLSKTRLASGDYSSFAQFKKQMLSQYADKLSAETLSHLLHLYGSDITALLKLTDDQPTLLKAMCASQPDIYAQVVFAARYEQAATLEDVVFRRTAIGFFEVSHAELVSIAKLLATELNWDPIEMEKQLNAVRLRIDHTQRNLSAAAETLAIT